MRDTLSAHGRPPTVPEQQHDFVRMRYRGYAHHYDRSYRRVSARSRALVMNAIGLDEAPSRVVDVCCGTGSVTQAIASRFPGAEVIGVDLSPEMLAQARERLNRHGSVNGTARGSVDGAAAAPRRTVKLFEAPAEHLPIERESVDLLVCANAFHLVDRQEVALAEFARVVRPGGEAVIVDWTAESIWMRALVMWLNLTQSTRRRMLTRHSLASIATRAGFEVEVSRRERIPPLWELMILRLRRR